MKTKIKVIAAIVFLFGMNSLIFAQNRKDRDRNDSYDARNNRNRDDDDRNDRDNRRDNDRIYDRDDRNDDDRIRDYSRGNNNYRRNPYDYRNLPNGWERKRSRDYDWYRFDQNNRFDPRYGVRGGFDNYFPWDPNNNCDIRNRRDFYGNNTYWNGARPNRIVIVPPFWALGRNKYNRGNSRHGRRW